MSFRNAFNRRRTPGYAGGTLEEQLLRDALLQSQEPQLLTPQNREAITRPRRAVPAPEEVVAPPVAQPSFKTRFAQPQPEPFGSSGEPFGSVRPRRTQPRDTIGDDNQLLRDLEGEPRGWKDTTVSVLDAISAGFGNKPRTTQTKKEREIATVKNRLGRDLAVEQKQAQIAGRQASLDEREVNNALSQYNRLEHYNPDDPAYAQLRGYFEKRGLELPKKDKYRRPIATWANGQLILTDDAGTRRATIDGEVVEDDARKPVDVTVGDQTFQVPQTQAEQSVRQRTEGAANRGAADTRSRRSQEGQDRRLRRRLNAPSRAGTAKGGAKGVSAAALRMAEKLNEARAIEMSTTDEKEKTKMRVQRETIWNNLFNFYPGAFEADEKGMVRPKAGSPQGEQQSGEQYKGRRISKDKIPEFARRHGMSAEEAAQFLSNSGAVVY